MRMKKEQYISVYKSLYAINCLFDNHYQLNVEIGILDDIINIVS